MNASAALSHAPVRLSALLALAGPVVVSRLGIMAMGLVDTVVVGRYSATELGYQALGWAPTAVVLMTSIGLLSGVQVLTSQAIGAGRSADTGAVLRRGLVYAFWLGIASGLLLAGAGPWLMHHFGLSPALADGASPVLQVLALSLMPILVADAGIFWLEAHGHPVRGMLCMWAANIVNLVLNLWLVPGTSPFAVDGAVASAWATGVSRVALLGFVAVVILMWPHARAMGLLKRPTPDPSAGRKLRRIGYAASLSYFVETAAFAAMSIFAGWLGGPSVATWAIVLNVASIIFMVPLGLSTATGVLVGRAYGARDRGGIRRAGLLGFAATLGATLLICAVVGFGNDVIAGAYTFDATVRAMTAAALLLSCLFLVADGLQVVGAQSLRAQNDIWVPTFAHSVSYVVIMMPLGWLFAIRMDGGVDGIVWAVIVASAVSAVLLLGRFAWLVRRH